MVMPPHIIGNSLISIPLAFAQNSTSTCSIGNNRTCYTTGYNDGINNPKSECLPDNNMDSSQAADYCSGFYSAHKELGAQNQPTSEPANEASTSRQNHPIVGSSVAAPAAESMSTSFSIPSGVTSAYLSGTVLITGGILSTVDFSIVSSDTGTLLMRQVYTDQGNIGIHIPAVSYTIILHNGSLLAGETHSDVNLTCTLR